ncbi:hypothetical protein M8C21_033295 [Ambrosia artemisiifolia]|uniref:Peptidase S10, serine carboxypeptidase, Alpha/Beta hydrolase fold protein n=1 Tax=Ambrosia artemisiifolia TaxID=4212 RepID=A0AAD5GI33_AMBAR|nr:hypothetical protein M8C21_033295 [Ambrosia artemisiifolia]
MKTNYICLSLLIIIVHLTALSKSKTIIKNLPGFHGDLPFTFETGYVEVGDDNEIQFFYYFVESQTDPLHDPLLLYLTGGPGTPALYPFMYQIGPLTINLERSTRDNITLGLNPNSWTKVYLEVWANNKDVQKALHVREGTVKTWQQNNVMLHYDLKKNDTIYYSYDIFSSIVYHRQLVERNCQVLIIKYRTIYTKNGYSLMHATVKGAGHSVALYKPEEASVIVNSWLASHTYLSDY